MAKKKVETPKTETTKEVKMGNEKKKVDIKEPYVRQQNVPRIPDTLEMFASKKDRGFIAMTQEVSAKSDETAKERRSQTTGNLPPRLANCIHKIREDK
jgi:hypothetical protein